MTQCLHWSCWRTGVTQKWKKPPPRGTPTNSINVLKAVVYSNLCMLTICVFCRWKMSLEFFKGTQSLIQLMEVNLLQSWRQARCGHLRKGDFNKSCRKTFDENVCHVSLHQVLQTCIYNSADLNSLYLNKFKKMQFIHNHLWQISHRFCRGQSLPSPIVKISHR